MDIIISTAYGTQTRTDYTLLAGETIALQIAITDYTKVTPINLTDSTLKSRIGLPAPLDMTSSNGYIAITDAAGGLCQINVADSVTDAWPPGTYPYDFWFIDTGGHAFALLVGTFTVLQAETPIP